ncbi:MAG: helix-turn-helix transcriptional regulator, partial [Bacteroidetes bacterium]|nr:helix-turn-helix transcriptional regulator [Bacteroidota bacterium]
MKQEPLLTQIDIERVKRKWSQKDLAKHSGVSRFTLGRIWEGKDWNNSTMIKILTAVGMEELAETINTK